MLLQNSVIVKDSFPVNRKATRPKMVENDASAKPPNLSSASCDLDLSPPGPQS